MSSEANQQGISLGVVISVIVIISLENNIPTLIYPYFNYSTVTLVKSLSN